MAGRTFGLLALSAAPSTRPLRVCCPVTTNSRFITSTVARPAPLSGQSNLRGVGFRLLYRSSYVNPSEDPPGGGDAGFEGAVSLFNGGDYHSCHDVLEDIWYGAEEPVRTLVHGILQCAVGLHHLFNQNHRGAMMQLGEGLCKLRKMDFEEGPFLQFEREISEVLEFLYQTQKELAACTEDICLAMDGSERSYQLLGSFAAGQSLYKLEEDPSNGVSYITFNPEGRYNVQNLVKVKIPTLHATEENLKACEYRY